MTEKEQKNIRILQSHGFREVEGLGAFKKEVTVDDFIRFTTTIWTNVGGNMTCDVQMKSGTQTDDDAVYIADGSQLFMPADGSVEVLLMLAEEAIENKLQKMSDSYSEKL